MAALSRTEANLLPDLHDEAADWPDWGWLHLYEPAEVPAISRLTRLMYGGDRPQWGAMAPPSLRRRYCLLLLHCTVLDNRHLALVGMRRPVTDNHCFVLSFRIAD